MESGSTYSDPGLLSGGSRHGLWSVKGRGNFSGCAGRTMVGVQPITVVSTICRISATNKETG